jgi:glycosyltransferase involved in cell wall biosynthesis
VALVHVHHSSYISFWRKAPLFAMAMLMRKPLVVSLHGGAFKEFYSGLPTPAQRWQRRVMRYACRYLVLTESWRAWALQVEPRARVEVVPNIAPQIPADVPTYPVDAINPSLLFLGRVEPLKGVPELIAALALALEAGARWNLVLAGEGAIEQTLEAARQKGLPPEVVRCVGWVDGEEKSQLLRACSAVVLPSHIENMPVAVVESFAYARPVVATRVGGVPDMVSDGRDGMLVSPRNPTELADALVSLWKIGGKARSVMGLAARCKCEQFYSANSLLERLDAAYSDCRRTG